MKLYKFPASPCRLLLRFCLLSFLLFATSPIEHRGYTALQWELPRPMTDARR